MPVPRIFDRRIYAMHRARARASFLARDVGENLAERLAAVNRGFQRGLDLGSHSEISAAVESGAHAWTHVSLASGDVIADEEALPFPPDTFDLVVSGLSLHAVNDLPGALLEIRRVLKPDGLFLAALFGGATLSELRAAFAESESDLLGGISPRVAPFADLRDLGQLLQRAGFALPVADGEKTLVRYRAFSTLVDDLRALGETNALAERARAFLRRDLFAAMLASYEANNADEEGRLIATYEVIYLTAWSPHESQPKPLRPGSAKARLADALSTREQSAGERAEPKPEGAKPTRT